jgi:hypothetical protein
VTGIWRDTSTPYTSIAPNGGDYTATGTISVNFALSCSDTGGSGCKNTYYKIINASQACAAGGFATGASGTVSCPFGQTCNLKACFYSDDNAGNTEAIKQSNTFIFGPRVCDARQCGDQCFGVAGICDGPSGSCYSSGGCLLNCVAPAPGAGNERIWSNPACGRTGSIKCGSNSVCGNSYASCSVGGASTQVTGNWATYTYPSGTYGGGQTFQITLGGVTKNPAGFAILSECLVRRPDGTSLFLDNWGTDITYSYTFRPADSEGVWNLSGCGLYSDFIVSSGWVLKEDSTPHAFILDKTPPSITINAPRQNDVYASGFVVNATVTDSYSSISSVQYRWENASNSGSWTPMNPNGGYYAANFNAGLVSDGSYSFRVRANDSVGNPNESVVSNIELDRRPPDIYVISPLQVWNRLDFEVKAKATDIRGVSTVRYRWENSTGNGQWIPMTLAADGNYTATFAVASVASGNYTIRVWANDSLGNAGNKTAGTGIDYESPSSYMTRPIAGSFIMTQVFNISWTVSDALSGVKCNYVVYRFLNGAGQFSGEYNVRFPGGNCTSLAQYEFNPAIELPSISDVNNYTFFFKSIALDNAGNLEAKAAWETNATVYIPKLVTFYAVEKVSGIIVRNGGKVANNRTVVVSVKAKDAVPGNFDITVYFNSHAPGTSSPQQLSAWNSFTCPSIRECNVSIDTITGESEDIRQVDYAILATTANSSELLPPSAPSSYFYYLVYRHPICNFLVNDIFRTTLGSGELISIEVRNFYNQFGMVGLKFDSGMARFLENGQQYIQIPLNPMEEKIIYARLIPPPPSQEGLPLIMTGNTTADYLLQDEDSITIIVGLPADFSELSNIAAVVVVALALIVFLKLAKA